MSNESNIILEDGALPGDLSIEESYIGSRMSEDNTSDEFVDNARYVRPTLQAMRNSTKRYYKEDQTLLETIRSKEEEMGFELQVMESSVQKFFRNAGTIALGPASKHSEEHDLKKAESFMKKQGDLSDRSKITIKEFIESTIEQEFPKQEQIPSAMGLINVGDLKYNRARYAPGDWVEIQGFDMKWRLDMITRVIKQGRSDSDFFVSRYKVSPFPALIHCFMNSTTNMGLE